MKTKKNNSEMGGRSRKIIGISGFGLEKLKESKKEEPKEPKKRGPKMQVSQGYRTVQKDKKLIFTVPSYGVEIRIDDKAFNIREFQRLFPSKYSEFNIIIDFAKEQVTFHVPYLMCIEHDVCVRHMKQGTFTEHIYQIRPQE